MGTTAKGFPYPEDTEPLAQGAAAIKALATAVDTGVGKVLRGLVNIPFANSTFSSVAVTFPVGFFKAPPSLIGSPGDTAPIGNPIPTSVQTYTITTASGRIGVRLSKAATGNVPTTWIAAGG